MQPRIAPSILSCDFANLESELESISNADLVHVDVMDGHFVPNITIGPPVVQRIFQISRIPLDVHLMIDNPENWLEHFAPFCHSLTFHFESTLNPEKTIQGIRSLGAKVGMAIRPSTGLDEVANLLPELDMLLVMTVEPGFGGQRLLPETLTKVKRAREIANESSLDLSIQVDGGITEANIGTLAKAGADTFVAGTEVFTAEDRKAKIDQLRALAITV